MDHQAYIQENFHKLDQFDQGAIHALVGMMVAMGEDGKYCTDRYSYGVEWSGDDMGKVTYIITGTPLEQAS